MDFSELKLALRADTKVTGMYPGWDNRERNYQKFSLVALAPLSIMCR